MKKFALPFVALLLFGCSRNVAPVAVEQYGLVPNARQVEWQAMGQYAFVHFSINTFSDREWGYGDESPELFNPTAMDADQIVRAVREAGLKGLILTAKHHDGFCLWPSAYTDHSIAQSPYKGGKGDIVREVADACARGGIKFGVYISPWDRNHAEYGRDGYVEYYHNQIKELFENYSPIFEIWFDGANGGDGWYGGAKEKRNIDSKTYYRWEDIVPWIHEHSPETVVWGSTMPDARWCGNESGYTAQTNWYVTDRYGEPLWVPDEVDVSIRPGWFWHANEKPRSAENLFEIYLSSVGRGSNLLLNLPPDRRGQIPQADVDTLIRWRGLIETRFADNLADRARISASSALGGYGAANVIKQGESWAAADNNSAQWLLVEWKKPQTINYVVIEETITLGQRIAAFDVEACCEGVWQSIATGNTIGSKRILKVACANVDALRITFTESKAAPVVSSVGIY